MIRYFSSKSFRKASKLLIQSLQQLFVYQQGVIVQQQEFGYGFLVVIYQYERERLHDGQLVKSTPVLRLQSRLLRMRSMFS